MSLRDDLIAAKALIDTPDAMELMAERSGECSPVMQAVYDTALPSTDGYSTRRFTELWWALVHGSEPPIPSLYNCRLGHSDIMALFDRAIASAQHEGHGETETGI